MDYIVSITFQKIKTLYIFEDIPFGISIEPVCSSRFGVSSLVQIVIFYIEDGLNTTTNSEEQIISKTAYKTKLIINYFLL